MVPHRPVFRLLLVAGALAAILGAAIGGAQYGSRDAKSSLLSMEVELDQLTTLLASVSEENDQLRRDLAVLDRTYVIDQQANSDVQATIRDLREQIAELETDVQFYRGAMTKDFENVGLVISQMDIESTDAAGRYAYKLVMRQQGTDGGSYLTGHAKVSLLGARGGEDLAIPLYELSAAEDEEEIRLRFRYFQNIEGELALPPDFVPVEIEVTAVATAPMAKTVERRFQWLVEGE